MQEAAARLSSGVPAAQELESWQAALFADRTARLRALQGATRAWLPHTPGGAHDRFDVGRKHREVEAPAITARHLIEHLQHRTDTPHALAALADLEPKHARAEEALEAACAGSAMLQDARRELRARAAELHRELIKLRTVLRVVLGASHSDYQPRDTRVRGAAAGAAAAQAQQPTPVTPPLDRR